MPVSRTHRSELLKDLKEADLALRPLINSARNKLEDEITQIRNHFEQCLIDKPFDEARRILAIVDYHSKNGNDLLVTRLIDGFFKPLRNSGLGCADIPNEIIKEASESFLCLDPGEYEKTMIRWKGDH